MFLSLCYGLLCMSLIMAASNHALESVDKLILKQLNMISDEWKIETFPKFLKSCQMHKSSWEIFKLKLARKIADEDPKHKKFVISFMGSSVAAGHDSLFNQSYPLVAETWMRPVFDALGIHLVVRNVAHGNNPCMPYDACVETIAGNDVDMVHWEQSYNCFDQPMYEQFARQSSFISSRPLVVYSASDTANWYVTVRYSQLLVKYRRGFEDCKGKDTVRKTPLDKEELRLLSYLNTSLASTYTSSSIEYLVSELNKDEYTRSVRGVGTVAVVDDRAVVVRCVESDIGGVRCAGYPDLHAQCSRKLRVSRSVYSEVAGRSGAVAPERRRPSSPGSAPRLLLAARCARSTANVPPVECS